MLKHDTMNRAKTITSDILKGNATNDDVSQEFLYKCDNI